MANKIDFEGLADELLSRVMELLPAWLPGGRMAGREYKCGSLRGGRGDSFSVNTQTGKWADFATDERGGDLVSLYAAIHGMKQGDAARELSEKTGFRALVTNGNGHAAPVSTLPSDPAAVEITAPPKGTPQPATLRGPYWAYRDATGEPIFYVSRLDTPEGKKTYIPHAWSASDKRWLNRAYPSPRPLYGLEFLAQTNNPVMIVEGEKACDAARVMADGHYTVVTWPNGAQAWSKADWTPLAGRNVLIWPDADEPGRAAGAGIAALLAPMCPQVKILDTGGQPDAWDAADALAEGWGWNELVAWAKPRASLFVAASASVVSMPGQDAQAVATASVSVSVTTEPQDIPDASLTAAYERLGLACNHSGKPYHTMDNVQRVLEGSAELKDFLWWDEFHHRIFTTWCNNGKVRRWEAVDTINLTIWLQKRLGLEKFTDSTVDKAIQSYAYRHKRNQPRDWMESLTWDGVERIDQFFVKAVGARNSDYIRAVARNFWVAMVARTYDPGCKFDHLVYLQGAQGIGKSTAWEDIGQAWHVSVSYAINDKDFLLSMKGKMIVELSELAGIRRTDVNAIKEVITRRIDNFQIRYDKMTSEHPRRCVLVGTTNEDLLIPDNTGARRFWPVQCHGRVDNRWIREFRDQLFAEAVAKYKRGDQWWNMPEESTAEIQEALRQSDPWEEPVAGFVTGLSEVTAYQVLTEALKMEKGKIGRADEMRIGLVLTSLGWTRHAAKKDGKSVKVWRRPADELPLN